MRKGNMKRVLITAGGVYGPLDANKLVGNRVRGIWASRFADFLADDGYTVTLLVPDVNTPLPPGPPHDNLKVVTHQGYWDYAEKCYQMAEAHDAAVMAGAVVNWIPEKPFPGKMPTKGYDEGAVMNIPFVLAPRVINKMRRINPNLTLIGCKMLVGSTPDELVDAAYHVSLTAKCNVVVANDMQTGLKTKRLVYPDRTVVDYVNDFDGFFNALRAVIEDEHYHTVSSPDTLGGPSDIVLPFIAEARAIMTRIVEKYRDRFTHRMGGQTFGSVLVPISCGGYLASPREKGQVFDGKDGILIGGVSDRVVHVVHGKATLNAPLLIRFAESVFHQRLTRPHAVLHLHEQLDGVPTMPYAPPGTARDNERDLPAHRAFNIEGHGFVACLDPETLEVLR